MSLFAMTLGDPLLPQTTPFATFSLMFHIFVVNALRYIKFGRHVDRSKS